MSNETKEYVSWEDLEELRTKLNDIAAKISDLHDTVSNAIIGVGESWQDSKYDEFASAYEPYKTEMERISEDYLRYANEVLPPIIDHLKSYDPLQMTL